MNIGEKVDLHLRREKNLWSLKSVMINIDQHLTEFALCEVLA